MVILRNLRVVSDFLLLVRVGLSVPFFERLKKQRKLRLKAD